MDLQTLQAEANHPQWANAIELIYPKAKDMMTKPRYAQIAYPLAITSLCVAPQEYFWKHWMAFFDISVNKLKVGSCILSSSRAYTDHDYRRNLSG